MAFVLIYVTFEHILDGFLRFAKLRKLDDGGPRWPPFIHHDAIIVSCDIIPS